MKEHLPNKATLRQDWYNLATLRQLSEQMSRVNTAPHPTFEIILAPPWEPAAPPVFLFPGAFNPPTQAHLTLAASARQASNGKYVFCSLSTMIINKEQAEGAALLDRLLLLQQIARRLGYLGVLLTNRGLYVEQAEAALATIPGDKRIQFLVGYDKIEQIFDARYYQDRDSALTRLFSLATVLVAPRATHEADDLTRLMHQPENQQFQPFVRFLPFPAEFRDLASSQIRTALQRPTSQQNEHAERSKSAPSNATPSRFNWLRLPPEANLFIQETGCYLPPQRLSTGETIDRYGIRTALIRHSLARSFAEQQNINLHALISTACSDTPAGAKLRRWLATPLAKRPGSQRFLRQKHATSPERTNGEGDVAL